MYPGNSGMAYPVWVLQSSVTLTPGMISPSSTYSALAMAFSSTVRQRHICTGSPRRAPAMDNSSNPRGVVGGSKQEEISITGSTPILMEMGRGRPSSSARRAMAPMCRIPGVKKMESSSRPRMHMRWMVTSLSPVSGWVA